MTRPETLTADEDKHGVFQILSDQRTLHIRVEAPLEELRPYKQTRADVALILAAPRLLAIAREIEHAAPVSYILPDDRLYALTLTGAQIHALRAAIEAATGEPPPKPAPWCKACGSYHAQPTTYEEWTALKCENGSLGADLLSRIF